MQPGRIPVFALIGAIVVGAASPPPGFHWVDFKQEENTTSRVRDSLRTEDYSAIREIGVIGNSALVLTTKRDPHWNTPEGDSWQAFDVDLRTGTARHLISGYQLNVVTWLTFFKSDPGELAVIFRDCYECEPAMLFTTFFHDSKRGWLPRWKGPKADELAGILLTSSDAGAPYSDDEVEQVWAVLQNSSGEASVGTWYHSRNQKTGEMTNKVLEFVVTAATNQERTLILAGQQARAWERKICSSNDLVPGLYGGQDTKSCSVFLPPRRR